MREILDRRNAYVVEQLAARLKSDGNAKEQTIAIFYGAAHMPGLEKEILTWGYRPTEATWFKAWRMNGRGKSVVGERAKETGRPATAPPARGAKREPVLY
jgi:hypothetical protein